MEARYGKARSPGEAGWWKSQVRRGRESRKAKGAPGTGARGSSRRQTSYSLALRQRVLPDDASGDRPEVVDRKQRAPRGDRDRLGHEISLTGIETQLHALTGSGRSLKHYCYILLYKGTNLNKL